LIWFASNHFSEPPDWLLMKRFDVPSPIFSLFFHSPSCSKMTDGIYHKFWAFILTIICVSSRPIIHGLQFSDGIHNLEMPDP
jgi:hypothetical protein